MDWAAGRFGGLADERMAVRDAVRRAPRAGGGENRRGVRGAHLDHAVDEWTRIDTSLTVPTAARYSGVVRDALDLPSLPAAAHRRAMSRIVVPSGPWGLVGAADPIPAYRLKMGARVDGLGTLAAWWRPEVSRALARRARCGEVIDLLPREHRAAIDASALAPGRVVRVEIVEDGSAGAPVGWSRGQAREGTARAGGGPVAALGGGRRHRAGHVPERHVTRGRGRVGVPGRYFLLAGAFFAGALAAAFVAGACAVGFAAAFAAGSAAGLAGAFLAGALAPGFAAAFAAGSAG
ncbi:MAG: peroxide stress protein YaaA, partial [Actinobacteria bacterium]|nr:peroxide stress protein YaaA [Actinomycetota bacterium]